MNRYLSTLSTRLILTFLACVTVALLLQPNTASAQYDRYDLHIPMPDTTWLAADLYTPDSTNAMPVIFIQTPYNKNKYRLRGMPLDTDDYAWVVMDWRGFYGSSQADNGLPFYGRDGADAIQWIADQPWCNGKIATYGGSALGQIQYLTAQYHPKGLVCSVPVNHALQIRYLKYYHAGVKRVEYIEALGGWNPVDMLVNQFPIYNWFWNWMEDFSDYSAEIYTPFLVITGWWDMNPDEALITYQKLIENSVESVRDDHRLMVGPWTHSTVGGLYQGDWTFPTAVGAGDQAALAFINHWMLGAQWGSQGLHNVSYFDLGTDDFKFVETWPPTEVEQFELYLNDQSLTTDPPTTPNGSQGFEYDPRHPVYTLGGRTFHRLVDSGPVDLNSLDSRDDVLLYETPPLTEPLEVTGYIRANIFMSSDRLDTDVTVWLADVFPNGRARLITDGIRRVRFRDSLSNPQLGEPGEIYELRIPMQNMAVTFLPGHKIRLYVSGSNWPRFDRNLNNGGEQYVPGDTLIASTTIYQNADNPSSLIFSVPAPRRPSTITSETGFAAADQGATVTEASAAMSVHPNPFNSATSVRIDLSQASDLRVDVYNVTGRLVATLAQGTYTAGAHTFTLDGSALASGVYFVRANLPHQPAQTQKILLLR